MLDYRDEINALREQIEELENKIGKIKHDNLGYFIGKTYTGDWNFWDEYYTPIGHMTQEEAEDIFAEWPVNPCFGRSEGHVGEHIFEVSESDYRKYGEMIDLQELSSTLQYSRAKEYIREEIIDEAVKGIGERLSALAKELGLNYYVSFQHVTRDP